MTNPYTHNYEHSVECVLDEERDNTTTKQYHAMTINVRRGSLTANVTLYQEPGDMEVVDGRESQVIVEYDLYDLVALRDGLNRAIEILTPGVVGEA